MSTIRPGELRHWLAERIAETCDLDLSDVDADRPLQEYGLTSRDALRLVGDLEDLLERDLPVALIWQHPTISALVSALLDEPAAADAVAAPAPGADPIAVIGLGCRLPGGVHGPDEFWRLLVDGRNAVTQVPDGRWDQFGHDSAEEADLLSRTTRWGGFLPDIAGFDAEFFGITPREAKAMDPQQRMLLEVAWEALEHAGVAPESLRGTQAGVFVGISGNEYSQLTLGDLNRVDAWTGTGSALSIAANRLSYALDLRGPSVAVDSACSSSLVAVHLAAQSLRSGESEVAIAAGVNLLLGPGVMVNFDQMGVTAADGLCKTFDASADGIARAEGAGVVVLKPLSAARRDGDRVLAVLRGSAVNSDGRSNGLTAPNPDAQRALLRQAYRAAGVNPSDVDYVEAHGTGTLLGDPIEANALGAVLGDGRPARHPLLIGSVKTNVGHLEAAAGITGLIKVVLSLANRRIPASLHFTEPNPHIPFDDLGLAVAAEQQPWPNRNRPGLAGVSGFGFGGTNAHVVVEQAPALDHAAPAPRVRPGQFLLAAPSPTRLRRSARALADWLAGEGEHVDLSNVEHTLARRSSGRTRAVVTASTRPELLAGLSALASGQDAQGVAVASRARTGDGAVWVFSGHGSQWVGMGQRLLATEPAFAEALDEVDSYLRAAGGPAIRALVETGTEPETFAETQPMLFGMQVALAALWRHYGAEPAAVIGHSLGEVAAAVVAGAVSLPDGAHIAVRRSRLLATLEGHGAMAVLELPADEVTALLAEFPDVDLAVFNSPGQTVVSGPHDPVAELVRIVEERGLLGRMVKLAVAGHSRQIDAVLPQLRAELAAVSGKVPTTRMYTTAADDPRSDAVRDAEYWAANMRTPVRFFQAVKAAVADGFDTFLEIAPHPIVVHPISETAPNATVLGTTRRSEDEVAHFHVNVGALIAAGELVPASPGRLIDLPTTPWLRTRHWTDRTPRVASTGGHPLLGAHIELPGKNTHLWRSEIGTAHQPWLADHRVGGTPILAGAAYVDMAFTAASTALGVPPHALQLTGLTLNAPLPLTEDTSVTTTCSADGRVEIHARDTSGEWVLHCAVTAEPVRPASAWRPSSEGMGDRLAAADLYSRLRELGVGYGPAFNGVSEVWAHPGGAVASVEVPEAAPKAGYLVHPSLVDACLQGFAAAMSTDGGSDDLFMPVEFGTVRLLGDPDRGVCAHLSFEYQGDDALVGQVRLVDAEDVVVLEITDVFARRVRSADLGGPLRDRLLERVWRQVPAVGERVSGPVVLVADQADPVALRASAAFTAAGLPTRIVSEVDNDALTVDPPAAVVYLAGEFGVDGLADAQHAILDLVDWSRAMTEASTTPARLWVVTTSAAAVLPDEAGHPGQASLRGLVRVLALEHPALRATWLDLDDVDPNAVAEDLVAEVTAGAPDDEVAVRASLRYAARLVATPAPEGDSVPLVRPDGGYVITGGLRGLGLHLAGWLVDQGATELVLNGRSAPTAAATAVIEELRATGASVQVVLGDIAEPGVAERLIGATSVPRGVVHAAAVFDDRTVSALDEGTLARSWRAKAHGAWRLHEVTKDLDIDWWLGFSSAASLHGLPGQPAYATANAYLDAVVAARRAAGLPGAVVNWGTWAEVGAAADIEVPWMTPISPNEGLGLIGDLVAAGGGSVGALRLNTTRFVGAFPALVDIPFFDDVLDGHVVEELPEVTGWAGVAALRELPPAEAAGRVAAQVRARVASVMGTAPDGLADDLPLTGLGVDSLVAVRIRNAFQHDFEVNLPVSVMLRGATLADLTASVCDELRLTAEQPVRLELPVPRRGVRVPPRDAAERLVVSVWQDVLGRPVGMTDEFTGDESAKARVAALMSERSGHEFSEAALFAQPSAELMANVVREAEAGNGPVRVLNAGDGVEPPVYFFHPGGGDTAVFRQLVDLLRVRAYGFDRVDGTFTVEQRVQRLVPELRAIQPEGPYRLAGWSFGGFLAYEAAQQLSAAGERVELLAMIDPILPLPVEQGLEGVELLEQRFARFGEFLETSYGRRVELPLAELARLDDEDQADLLVRTIRESGVVDPRVSEAILAHQRSSFLDARLLERYQPSAYDGRVVFYSAEEMVPGGLRDQRFDRQDPARGWDAVCPDMDLVVVPGHHLSLLDPPNVDVIAAHLGRVLTAVRS